MKIKKVSFFWMGICPANWQKLAVRILMGKKFCDLFLDTHANEVHRGRITRKLGVTSIAQMVKLFLTAKQSFAHD